MRKIFLLILVSLLSLTLASCNDDPTTKTNEEETKTETVLPTETETITPDEPTIDEGINYFISTSGLPLLCAHRGGSVKTPENTMKAFKYSVEECDVDILESDVWLTKDGHLIMLHDNTVTRTSDAKEYLDRSMELAPDDFTLAQLQELNFGANFVDQSGNKPYQNIVKNITDVEQRKEIIKQNEVSIVTLDELFGEFYDTNKDLLFVIEIKNSGEKGCLVADKIAELLTKYPDYKRRVSIGTFNNEVEQYLKENYSDLVIGASTNSAQGFLMDVLYNNSVKDSYDFDCLQIPTSYYFNGVNVDLIDAKVIQSAHEKNISVQFWTINDEATMRRLVDVKCDAIMTDNPALLRAVLNDSI